MNITTVEELKKIGEGEIIELPPFDSGASLTVRVRKPDITMMIIDGKIPNPLVEITLNLTESGKREIDLYKKDDENKDKIDIEKTRKYFNFLQVIAKNCLISPTYDDIEKYTGGLNLQQLMAIFEYSQKEVNSLKSFRNER